MPTAEKKDRSQSAPGYLLSSRRVIPSIKQLAQLFHHLVPYHTSRATKIAGDVKGFETREGKSCFCHKWPSPEPAVPGTSCRGDTTSATPSLSPSISSRGGAAHPGSKARFNLGCHFLHSSCQGERSRAEPSVLPQEGLPFLSKTTSFPNEYPGGIRSLPEQLRAVDGLSCSVLRLQPATIKQALIKLTC